MLFENCLPFSFMLHPKLIWDILKTCAKSKCACFNEIIWLTIMKIRVKMNNRSHRYYMTITRLRHGCNYTKYKKCLSIMMVICNKQHLSHNWNQHWGWVAYIKKSCIFENSLTHRQFLIRFLSLVGIKIWIRQSKDILRIYGCASLYLYLLSKHRHLLYWVGLFPYPHYTNEAIFIKTLPLATYTLTQ